MGAVIPALHRFLDSASGLAFRSTCRAADKAWTAARGRIHRTLCKDAVRHGPVFFAWILGGPESGALHLTMECSDWAVSRLLEAALELAREPNPVLDVLWECDVLPKPEHVRAASRSGCIDRLLRAIELYDRWLTDRRLNDLPLTDDVGVRALRGAFHAACEAAHPDVSPEVMTAVREHYPELVPTPTQPPSQDRDRRAMYAAFARTWLDLTLRDWLWRPDGTLVKYGNTEPDEDRRFCPRMFPWDAALPPGTGIDVRSLWRVLDSTDFRNVLTDEAHWSSFLESCARRREWGAREMHQMAVGTETWHDPEYDRYDWENFLSLRTCDSPICAIDDGPVRAALACGRKELAEELLEMAVGLETRLREDCLKEDPTADFEYPTVRGPFASCFVAASRKDPSLYPTLRRLFSEEEIREAERRLQPSMHEALVGGDWDAVRRLRAAGNDWSYRDWWDAVRAGASIERLRRMLADGLPAKRSFYLADLYGMHRTVARLLEDGLVICEFWSYFNFGFGDDFCDWGSDFDAAARKFRIERSDSLEFKRVWAEIFARRGRRLARRGSVRKKLEACAAHGTV